MRELLVPTRICADAKESRAALLSLGVRRVRLVYEFHFSSAVDRAAHLPVFAAISFSFAVAVAAASASAPAAAILYTSAASS